jgi:predicted PurR-regulated permease PerM
MTTRRLATGTAAVCLTLTAALMLWRIREIALAIVAGWVLAAALRPSFEGLRRSGLPRGAALAVNYGLVLLVLVALAVIVGGPLFEELARATDLLSVGYERLLRDWAHGASVERRFAAVLPTPRVLYKTLGELRPSELASGALSISAAILALAVKLVIVFVLSIYWSVHHEEAERKGLLLVSARHRAQIRRVLSAVEAGVGRHVFAEGTKSILTIAVLALLFRLMGLSFPTLPAAFAGAVRIVPFAGWSLTVAAAALAGAQTGPVHAAAAALLAGTLLVVLDRALIPRLLAARSYHPVVVVVVVVTLTPAYGWAGLVAAPAIAAGLQILLETTLLARSSSVTALDSPGAIRARYEALRARVGAAPGALGPEVHGLVRRLGRLVAALEAEQESAARAALPGAGVSAARGWSPLEEEPRPADRSSDQKARTLA